MHMNTISSLLIRRPAACLGFLRRHMFQRAWATPRGKQRNVSAKRTRFRPGFVAIMALAALPFARADVVTDWNAALEASLLNPTERGPRGPGRIMAIMHAAMFDAVNGIIGKYQPCHVTEPAPPGSRPEAAAIQAAYTTLSTLRPAFQSAYDAQLEGRARTREEAMAVANCSQ